MAKKKDAQDARERAVGLLNFWLGLREKELVMAKTALKNISKKIIYTVGRRNITKKILKQVLLSIWCYVLIAYANAKTRTVTKIEDKIKAIKTALHGLGQSNPDPSPAIKLLSEHIHYSSVHSDGIDDTAPTYSAWSGSLLDLISGLSELEERTG